MSRRRYAISILMVSLIFALTLWTLRKFRFSEIVYTVDTPNKAFAVTSFIFLCCLLIAFSKSLPRLKNRWHRLNKLFVSMVSAAGLAVAMITYFDLFQQQTLVSNGNLVEASRPSVLVRDNPFRDQSSEFVQIKRSSQSPDQLFDEYAEFLGNGDFESDTELSHMAMLLVSGTFVYGNQYPNQTKVGCAIQNEERGMSQDGEPLVADSRNILETWSTTSIGCCTDYAFLLSGVLDALGIENRFVTMPGHIANEAYVDGKWWYLDATSLLAVSARVHEITNESKIFVYAPTYSDEENARLVQLDFQNDMMNSFYGNPTRIASDSNYKSGINTDVLFTY